MILGRVSLPDELQIALEEGRLVIFAGAGVSMPPPSNLPTFNGLASQIAGGERVDGVPTDKFLGKLQRERGTDVHAAAANILYGDHTQPTPLHREILRLFGKPAKARVVTTNFDDHFSAAAHKQFGKMKLREYWAPALPLGDDFSGLVYLHGSARIDRTKLVLTDRDFGAAYLTRAWARDFLVSLFSSYSVLFVGYSHNDVTTSYLARGLNPSQVGKRWALVSSDTDANARENWNHLDISVIEHPIDPDHSENKHHALTDFFSQWADHRTESIFTRASRIKALAGGLPPEAEVDAAYLRYCLSNLRLAQEFCNSIRHPAWVGWMHDRGYFNGLFTDSAEKAEGIPSEHIIVHWLCSFVRTRFPEFLLELISRHQQRLTLRFSRALAQSLWSDRSKKVDPRFATWLSIVLSQGQNVVDGDTWGYLLKKCRLPDHLGVSLRIFEFLTIPNVQLRQSWWGHSTDDSGDQPSKRNFKVDFEIEWPEKSGYCLREAWTEVFQPQLSDIADPLSQIVVKQLTQAYLLLRGVVKDHNLYDRISRSRSSIASHEQDDTSLNECLDCLIDILRCILDHWIETNSAQARAQADAWWSSKLLLLQRFAAYAYSHDLQYAADERIRWVLANDLVFLSGMKKEVFDILASAYGQASPGIRQRLLRRIDRGIRGREAKWLDEEILTYEKFNVLIWLRRADPGCPLVQSAISAIQGQFPKFSEREYPEFDSWHSTAEFIDPTQDFDLNLILSKPSAEFASELIQARRDPQLRVLQNHIRCLPRLFPNNKTWTEGFIQTLSKSAAIDDEVWGGVVWGLRKAIQTEEDWRWVISLIEMLPRNTAIHEAMANLLSWGLKEHHTKMGEELIERAADLMDVAWNLCKDKEEPADSGYGDWLTTAMGHAGGWFGDFWVHYCNHLRKSAGGHWQGIPDPLKTKIIDGVSGTSRIKVHARIALTPWIGYFFTWDRDFTSSFLLPLLDWKRDPVVAQQSWSVLLNYKRGTTKDFEAQLLPFYRQCAEQITSMMKEATEKSGQFNQNSLWRLGSQLAMLAIHVVSNPVESGFFCDFLPLLPDRARASLANTIGEYHWRTVEQDGRG